MIRLFSNRKQTFLQSTSKPEVELNRFICEHWNDFFPQLTFIASEFPLKGSVRSSGTAGRIDIFAFNPKSKKFVILELKKGFDKHISNQAFEYTNNVTI